MATTVAVLLAAVVALTVGCGGSSSFDAAGTSSPSNGSLYGTRTTTSPSGSSPSTSVTTLKPTPGNEQVCPLLASTLYLDDQPAPQSTGAPVATDRASQQRAFDDYMNQIVMKLVTNFQTLANTAPDAIKPDVRTINDSLSTMVKPGADGNPSIDSTAAYREFLGTRTPMGAALLRVKAWTKVNCLGG